MTNTGKDAASFFENGTTEQFEYCYNMYPQVLKIKAEKRSKKPQELMRLDDWYQNKLPKLIKERGRNAHIEYEELVQTMKWKQTRGKFYPQLSYLIKVNTPRAVLTETKKAFRKLPNLEQAITALSNLKGVGTTMASALLAAASPDLAPFMADECLMAIPEIEGIDYTTKEYLNFVQHMQATVQRLNAEAGGEKPFWSPHRVELALWAHQVANDLSPELLEKMPTGKGGGGGGGGVGVSKANGNTAANRTLNDGISDDTNDGENERAAFQSPRRNVGLIGGGLSEPDTENENTNPITQDGDSNFVSNDSMSHEPIIDENTTQTTATTTTDEGEGDVDAGAGTPLASDSESNIEPPLVVQHSSISNTNHGKSKEADNSSISAVNGNGTATVVAAPTDGDNSNCLRESEYDDESSSNSNTPRNNATITPLINHLDTSIAKTESTLSGCAAPKRAHNFNDGSINSLLENEVQPDLKKRRSE